MKAAPTAAAAAAESDDEESSEESSDDEAAPAAKVKPAPAAAAKARQAAGESASHCYAWLLHDLDPPRCLPCLEGLCSVLYVDNVCCHVMRSVRSRGCPNHSLC